MPYPIEAVKRKGERQSHLYSHHCRKRPCSDCSGKRGSVEMPAEEGGDEVRSTEDVEAAAENGAGDPV